MAFKVWRVERRRCEYISHENILITRTQPPTVLGIRKHRFTLKEEKYDQVSRGSIQHILVWRLKITPNK